MLKRLLNECTLTLELKATGRFLTKETKEETKRQSQDHKVAQPEKTILPNGDETIYLPGSSLKGALRAQAERIARSLNPHNAGACDPFTAPNDPQPHDLACSERLKILRTQQNTEPTPAQHHHHACPICQTFGYLGLGRRLRITDFYPTADITQFDITHISIDRATGGVSQPYKGKKKYGPGRTFNQAYTYQAHLKGQIILENYTLWQLGLLGLLYQDLADGLIPLGHKQTSGAGDLRPHKLTLQLTRLGQPTPQDGLLQGIGALYRDGAPYGYHANDKLDWPDLKWTRPAGQIRHQTTLTTTQATTLWQALIPPTAHHLTTHQWLNKELIVNGK